MVKNFSHSIKAKLLNLSCKDNKRYQQLLIRYMQERFLHRLSESKYRKNFVLKGGALLYAYDEFLPRPTLDIDFMGMCISGTKDNLIHVFKEISSIQMQYDGVRFIPESVTATDIAVDKKYPGIRLTLVGFLDTIKKLLSFDVVFGDVAVPPPVTIAYPSIFEDMQRPSISVITLETVIAEKFQTIVEKSVFNSRMKDFYDVYRIISVHAFNEEDLISALRSTFENRSTSFDLCKAVFSSSFSENEILSDRWDAFCRKMRLVSYPSFSSAMSSISSFLKPFIDRITNL